jgi:hypothetical protein
LKWNPAGRALDALTIALVAGALLLATLSLTWREVVPDGPPELLGAASGKGLLLAGFGVRRLELGPAPVIGGFPRWSYTSEGVRDPVTARALLVSEPGARVALVSVEILVIPELLEAAVRGRLADLKLDALVLTATHTHSGPGGYWDSYAAGRFATGPYDQATFDRLVEDVVAAVRAAQAALGPATLSVQRAELAGLVQNRNGGRVGGQLLVARLARPSGEPVAELVRFTAHPTFHGQANRMISGDWPGRLLALGVRGPRLFWQGTIGDQSVRVPPSAAQPGEAEDATYARLLDDTINALQTGPADASPRLAVARVVIGLPRLSPGAVPHLLWPATRTVLGGALPTRATVTTVRLGPLLLVATPAEPTETVGVHWRLVAGPDAVVLSLANGYVGYVVTEEDFAAGLSETQRSYYGPDLDERLARAIAVAARTVDGASVVALPH